MYRIISEHRGSGEDRGDLLSTLLAARDEDGSQMSDRQLRDEVMTLFLAGHETTALTLSWTWYLLGITPDAEKKFHAELGEVIGDRLPTFDDLPRLKYAEQIAKESMRLYPPAYGLGREAINDCEIGGYPVPAGTQVFMFQWSTQRDARFFDDPLAFKPERSHWLADKLGAVSRRNRWPVCTKSSGMVMTILFWMAMMSCRLKTRRECGKQLPRATSLTQIGEGYVWDICHLSDSFKAMWSGR